ncbi:MAG: hypothetical protein GWN18_04970, partial [Thermoplasmata archaeon]|nr:hypothetical protein [Thermoplasmata archaeon]NIS11381.1 hypothetical protein [Thermoplasmata archaeon]NIS19317.1 hypothetical protein [Thermoplasmata archaeon]NIT76409.1 hypothetical protein [Thermoplasmata archaeon]NIU48445.1 hypothetical protein [Thermoplasmata archaeon]
FTENLGQVAGEGVLFHARGDGISVTFTPQGVDYVITRDTGRAEFHLRLGDRRAVTPVGQGPLGHRVNYLLGDDPSMWVRQAATFESVLYEGVYPGVDVRFHFLDDMLKYDVIVAPGTDLDDVVLKYRGVDGLSVDPATGDLIIHTAAGPIRDARPVFLQEGLGTGVPGAYRLLGEGRFGFLAPEGVVNDVPTVIDPGIEFSTLLVGSQYDEVLMVGVDPDGDIIVGGQ